MSPAVYKGKVVPLEVSQTALTKMRTSDLIAYEKYLWRWMKKSPPNIVALLNAIHREIEWRSMDKEWDRAQNSQR
jgi:hypothetical protein